MPLNKLGAVSTMARGYPLGVFLGAFLVWVYPGFIPTSSSLTWSRCVTETHAKFFVDFFSPKKMLVKPHKYFRFPNKRIG